MPIPYIGFGNDTLNRLPEVKPGDLVNCGCGQSHPLQAADDGSTFLLFYKCGTTPMLGAVKGRLVVGRRADMKGEL